MNNVLEMPIPIDLGDDTIPIVQVDDDEIDRALVKRIYKRSGLVNPLLQFSDGASFLEYLKIAQEGKTPLPALVLMDINMPQINGFDIVKSVRQNEAFSNLPVVMMLTSSHDPQDREQAAAVGANGYMIKPYNPSHYLDLFKQLKQN